MLNRDPRVQPVDPRVEHVQFRYKEKRITCIEDIFPYLRKTPLAEKMGMTLERFNGLMKKVEKFTMEDLLKIARIFNWELEQVVVLWKEQYKKQQEKKIARRVKNKS